MSIRAHLFVCLKKVFFPPVWPINTAENGHRKHIFLKSLQSGDFWKHCFFSTRWDGWKQRFLQTSTLWCCIACVADMVCAIRAPPPPPKKKKKYVWIGLAVRWTLTPKTSPENPPLTLAREWYHPGVTSRNLLTSAFLGIVLSCLRAVYVSTLKGINSLKRIKWNVLAVKMVSLKKTRRCHWNVQNVAKRLACLTPHPLQGLNSLTSVSKKF